MVAFGHTALGASAGILAYGFWGQSQPVTGLLAAGGIGILSHYIADFIPHGHFIKMRDFKSKIFLVIIFDLLLSIIAFTAAAYLKNGLDLKLFYILFGIGGSQLPDVADGLIYLGMLPKKGFIKYENNFHRAMHWHGRDEKALVFGLTDMWQFFVAFLAFYLVLIS